MSGAGNTYMAGERRKVEILDVGVRLWRSGGEAAVTARAIGRDLGITHAAVLYHFGSSDGLRSAVAQHALSRGDGGVIRQMITANHPAIAPMSEALRKEWLLT